MPIENQFNIATWASYLKSILPQFEKVYSGNDYVTMLLANSGYDVIQPKFLDREKYNGTQIRKMILNDQDWEKCIPSAASKIIKKINGVNRIKTISKTDTKPQEF